ncbi:hypothetical protein MUK70_15235 [Dyadobacter chenwenxiniae]|uniref:Uncharacterized protein n=1 Tax=Dyadobacter chenwenxiniae TaxID=2906456 RepID=A0A9X1TC84_9BACT|nr:hypothetical protein [Dyadobacter chenwenxiniae]MCF0060596.1 hypothetical protein [Dyadobacter chenwenxiniae]UON86327.1 hypothetical protein MUK70_15235 [Dyadobacter chenwenxiniae]
MKKYLLFSMLMLILGGCEKDNLPDKMPEVYVYANVNGEKFRYEGEEDYFAENKPWVPQFQLGAFLSDFEGLAFSTEDALSGKSQTLKINSATFSDSRYTEYSSGDYSNAGKPTNGKCTITHADNYVVEGTFYFDVYDEDGYGNKKLSIKDGRFRVKYN